MREGRVLTDGRQRHPTPLPQRPKSTRACWRSLCSPPWLCMDANAHEPRPRPQTSALPLPRYRQALTCLGPIAVW